MKETYEPNYIYWYDREFQADPQVSRGMNWLQRHFYRALCIGAFYCSDRPYLPADDSQLWLLADAESKDQWIANKGPVLVKFQPVTIKGVELLSHKRIQNDWKLMIAADKQRHDAARAGGEASGRTRKAKADQKLQGEKSKRTPQGDEAAVQGKEAPGSKIEPTEPDSTGLNGTELKQTVPNGTKQKQNATVLDANRTEPNAGRSDSDRAVGVNNHVASLSDSESGTDSDRLRSGSVTKATHPYLKAKDIAFCQTLDTLTAKDGGEAAYRLNQELVKTLELPEDHPKFNSGPISILMEDFKASTILIVIRFIAQSDFWGKTEKGKIGSTAAFAKSFRLIKKQSDTYWTKCEETDL